MVWRSLDALFHMRPPTWIQLYPLSMVRANHTHEWDAFNPCISQAWNTFGAGRTTPQPCATVYTCAGRQHDTQAAKPLVSAISLRHHVTLFEVDSVET